MTALQERTRQTKSNQSSVNSLGQARLYHESAFGPALSYSHVDRPEFKKWAVGAKSFSYVLHVGGFVARNERRGDSGGGYWYAFRKHDEKVYKVYIGKTETLSLAALQKANSQLDLKIYGTGDEQQ